MIFYRSKKQIPLTESVLAARFNFFVVFFGIILAGTVSATKQEHLQAILSVGFIVCLLIALTIVRIQMKIDYVIRQLHKAKPEHAATKVHDEVKGPSLRWIIGYLLPALCTIILLIAAVMAFTGILTV